MHTLTLPVEDYFCSINISRGKIFTILICILCSTLAIIVDPIIFDLSIPANKAIFVCHIFISSISFITFFPLKFVSSKRIACNILLIYLFLISLTEIYISGAIDTGAERGPTVFIGTILIISFIFLYKNSIYSVWFFVNYSIFVFLVLNNYTEKSQLVACIGNGTIFTIIIFIIRLFIYNSKVKEYENQKKIIGYILEKKRKKEKPSNQIPNNELIPKLYDFVVKHQNYLDPNISLASISKELGTNTKYLSQLINTNYNKNFNTFINDFRVDEAKRIMNHKLGSIITIEAIAQQAGFHSKSSFYTAFKANTGLTPNEYMKNKSQNIS